MTRRLVLELTDDETTMLEEARGDLSASAFLRKAFLAAIRRQRDEESAREIAEAYRRFPETEDELALGTQMAALAMADEPPWDE